MKKQLTSLIIASTIATSVCFGAVRVAPNPYKNPQKAFQYVYNLSVTQNNGDKWSTYLLGSYYEKGYGTSIDLQKAYVWYKMSSIQKYQPAIQALAALKSRMSPSEINQAEKAFKKVSHHSIEKDMYLFRHVND